MPLSQEIRVIANVGDILRLCHEGISSYQSLLGSMGVIVQKTFLDEHYRTQLASSERLWEALKDSLQNVHKIESKNDDVCYCYLRLVRALVLLMRNLSVDNQSISQELLIQNVLIRNVTLAIFPPYNEMSLSLYITSLAFLHNSSKPSVCFDKGEMDALMNFLQFPSCDKSMLEELIMPYTMFFLNLTTSDDFLYYFSRHPLCHAILCDRLINQAALGHSGLFHHLKNRETEDHELGPLDAVLVQCFVNLATNESFETLINTVGQEDSSDLLNLLRLVQLAITSRNSWNDSQLAGVLSWCFPLFKKTADLVKEYFKKGVDHLETAQILHDKLNISLDIVSSLSHFEYTQKYLLSYNGLEELVALLGLLQKNLIRVNTYKTTNGSVKSMKIKKASGAEITDRTLLGSRIDSSTQRILPTNFPECKSVIIEILAMLAHNRAAVKDRIREIHGLELILSNCVIDDNDPFIKERSIVCIKFLLQDNQENQAFVAKLEAKKAVQDDVISEAGYEIKIGESGNVSLKPKDDNK